MLAVPSSQRSHRPVPPALVPSCAQLAENLFDALGPLHRLPHTDAESLRRAAAGLRFIRSAGTCSLAEHSLFSVALADLGEIDAWVVEAASCLAVDVEAPAAPCLTPLSAQHRALWFAAVLRLAEAFSATRIDGAPGGVFVTWTADILYLELDGLEVDTSALETARGRVAALELLSSRRVVLGCSASRRGAA